MQGVSVNHAGLRCFLKPHTAFLAIADLAFRTPAVLIGARMKTLLLWDIDGTLIASGNAGMRALQASLASGFAMDRSLHEIDFGGRTDRWIMRAIFEKFNLPVTEENFVRLFDGYLSLLPSELANPQARVLPGIRPLLDQLAGRTDITQGLLTGNIRRGAELKLAHHGLWDYFPFGAFADDAELRNDLGPFALRRAFEHTGVQFSPDKVWIIGDTPHDVACARAIGARAIAVATGHADQAKLRAAEPDAYFEDLNDAQAFIELITVK